MLEADAFNYSLLHQMESARKAKLTTFNSPLHGLSREDGNRLYRHYLDAHKAGPQQVRQFSRSSFDHYYKEIATKKIAPDLYENDYEGILTDPQRGLRKAVFSKAAFWTLAGVSTAALIVQPVVGVIFVGAAVLQRKIRHEFNNSGSDHFSLQDLHKITQTLDELPVGVGNYMQGTKGPSLMDYAQLMPAHLLHKYREQGMDLRLPPT